MRRTSRRHHLSLLGGALALAAGSALWSPAPLAAQSSGPETGDFVAGGMVIWIRATDAGVVQLFMSRGYRDAFARPIVIPAGALRRWADSALAMPKDLPAGRDTAEVRGSPAGSNGPVLERWIAARNSGVRILQAGQPQVHMADVPGRDFIAALARAAQLSEQADAAAEPAATPLRVAAAAEPLPQRAEPAPAPPPPVAPAPDTASPAHLPSLTEATVATLPVPTAPSARRPPRVVAREEARARTALVAPPPQVPTLTEPSVASVRPAASGPVRTPRLARLPARAPLRVVLIPAPATPAVTPATVPAVASAVAPVAKPPTERPAAPPPPAHPAAPTKPAPAAPGLEDKHIRTPLGPFVIPAAEMRSRDTQIRYCYARLGLRYDPDLTGSVTLHVTLDPAVDTVVNVQVVARKWSTDGVTAGEVEACTRTLAHDWQYAASEINGARIVELHFSFRPSDAAP